MRARRARPPFRWGPALVSGRDAAGVAQSAECLHGKEEVRGSIPLSGSKVRRTLKGVYQGREARSASRAGTAAQITAPSSRSPPCWVSPAVCGGRRRLRRDRGLANSADLDAPTVPCGHARHQCAAIADTVIGFVATGVCVAVFPRIASVLALGPWEVVGCCAESLSWTTVKVVASALPLGLRLEFGAVDDLGSYREE